MRIQINNEDYEVRVQNRTVTFCDIMSHGKIVAKGIAIQNPKDVTDGNVTTDMGARIAAGRALKFLDSQGEGFNIKAKTSEIVDKVQKRDFKKMIHNVVEARDRFKRDLNAFMDNLKYNVTRGTGYFQNVFNTSLSDKSAAEAYQGTVRDGGLYGYDAKIVQILPRAEVARRYPGYSDPTFGFDSGTAPGVIDLAPEPELETIDGQTIARRILGYLR